MNYLCLGVKSLFGYLHIKKYSLPLQSQKAGAIAQLVEQRTENPCVPSSILGGTTKAESKKKKTPESH